MFGNSMLGGGFVDEIMGNQMRQMNNMMNAMMGGNPFGGNSLGQGMSLMPFGMPGNNMMMSQLMNPNFGSTTMSPHNMLMSGAGSFSSSSTIISMGGGANGQPQVYRESSSTVTGPGGVRETKKSVMDSRTGKKKMSIGHYLGERAHIKEKEQNLFTGDREENDEFVNIEEEEADEFTKEWERKAGRHRQPRPPQQQQLSIGYHNAPAPAPHSRSHYNANDFPALPAPAPAHPSSYRHNNYKSHNKFKNKHSDGRIDSSTEVQQKKKQRSKPYLKKSKKSSKE